MLVCPGRHPKVPQRLGVPVHKSLTGLLLRRSPASLVYRGQEENGRLVPDSLVFSIPSFTCSTARVHMFTLRICGRINLRFDNTSSQNSHVSVLSVVKKSSIMPLYMGPMMVLWSISSYRSGRCLCKVSRLRQGVTTLVQQSRLCNRRMSDSTEC